MCAGSVGLLVDTRGLSPPPTNTPPPPHLSEFAVVHAIQPYYRHIDLFLKRLWMSIKYSLLVCVFSPRPQHTLSFFIASFFYFPSRRLPQLQVTLGGHKSSRIQPAVVFVSAPLFSPTLSLYHPVSQLVDELVSRAVFQIIIIIASQVCLL